MHSRPGWETTSAERASRSVSRPSPGAVRDRNAGLRPTFAPTGTLTRLTPAMGCTLFHERSRRTAVGL